MKYDKYYDSLTLGNKLARLVWNIFYLFFFRALPGPLFRGWRCQVLRLWGAKIGKHCAISASAKIWAPWNLSMGDYVAVGPCAELYNVGMITMGSNITISQCSYICTASHDIGKIKKPLVYKSIAIADSVWISSRAIILPGVKIGTGAVVAAGAVVTKVVAPWNVIGGNPAKFIKMRILRDDK